MLGALLRGQENDRWCLHRDIYPGGTYSLAILFWGNFYASGAVLAEIQRQEQIRCDTGDRKLTLENRQLGLAGLKAGLAGPRKRASMS